MKFEKQHRNVLVLSATQSTLQITGVTMIAVTGLAGYALADNKSFATVPLTCYVFGSAMTTIPASFLMKWIGRRGGFQTGTTLGMIGGAICTLAMYFASFYMLCAGMMVMGMYTAFGKYYRFAAADAASDSFRAKAISFTLAGGILGGIIGPELAKRTKDLFTDHMYMGSYLSLIAVCFLATLILTRLDIPQLSETERQDPGRPLGVIMRQPVFIVAALSSMLSYGIMNLMMTSTPLAMRAHEHPFNDAAFVLEWHIIGMYGPSFFTGSLIQSCCCSFVSGPHWPAPGSSISGWRCSCWALAGTSCSSAAQLCSPNAIRRRSAPRPRRQMTSWFSRPWRFPRCRPGCC
jgi:MFS family permease